MESIIIHSSNKKDLDLLQYLAQKMGLETQILNQSAKEDVAIMQAIDKKNPAENLNFEDAVTFYQSLNKAK